MAIIHSRENIANVTFVRPLRPGNYIYSPNRVANSTSSERLPFMAFGIDHAGTRVDALIPHLNSGCCAWVQARQHRRASHLWIELRRNRLESTRSWVLAPTDKRAAFPVL